MSDHEPMKFAALAAMRRHSSEQLDPQAAFQVGYQKGWADAITWCADNAYAQGRLDAAAEFADEADAIYDAGHAQARADNDSTFMAGYADGLADSAGVVARLKEQLHDKED